MGGLTRRDFMQGILAAAVAPAIVRVESLMSFKGFILPQRSIVVPIQEIASPVLAKGERLFSAMEHSMAFLDARVDGLVEFRRFPVRGGTMVQFVLPKIKPRYVETLLVRSGKD